MWSGVILRADVVIPTPTVHTMEATMSKVIVLLCEHACSMFTALSPNMVIQQLVAKLDSHSCFLRKLLPSSIYCLICFVKS